MNWQEPIVALLVLLAAGELLRRVWRLFAGRGSGCGSCGKSAAGKGGAQLVELRGPGDPAGRR